MMFVSKSPRLGMGRVAVLGLAFALSSTAAADEKPATSRTYVGKLDGAPKNTLIAIVVQGRDVMAYACSEDEGFNTRTARWFRGAVADDQLRTASDGVKLTAAIGKDAVTGTLTGDDQKPLKFKAAPAGERAGLFRAEGKVDDEDHVAGWIVDGQGTVVGSHHHKKFSGTGGAGGSSGFGGSNFHHKQTFKFPTNHAFHKDFNFSKHFFFQQGMHQFHAKKFGFVPPTHGGKK